MKAAVKGGALGLALMLLVSLLTAASAAHAPKAHADFLQCPYPLTCFYFEVVPGIGNIRGFVADAPIEENGAHWHAELGGAGVTVGLGANAAVPGLQGVNGSAQAGISVTLFSASWRCNDQRYFCGVPTVVGTWNKDRPPPKKGHAIGRAPTAPLAPWPPTTDVDVKVSWPPESDPQPDMQTTLPVPTYGSDITQAPLSSDPLPNVRQGG